MHQRWMASSLYHPLFAIDAGTTARMQAWMRKPIRWGDNQLGSHQDCPNPCIEPHSPRLQVQTTVLRSERPNLVVFSGDMVSGFAWDGSAGWFEHRWQQLLAPVRAAGVPHATVLGKAASAR